MKLKNSTYNKPQTLQIKVCAPVTAICEAQNQGGWSGIWAGNSCRSTLRSRSTLTCSGASPPSKIQLATAPDCSNEVGYRSGVFRWVSVTNLPLVARRVKVACSYSSWQATVCGRFQWTSAAYETVADNWDKCSQHCCGVKIVQHAPCNIVMTLSLVEIVQRTQPWIFSLL